MDRAGTLIACGNEPMILDRPLCRASLVVLGMAIVPTARPAAFAGRSKTGTNPKATVNAVKKKISIYGDAVGLGEPLKKGVAEHEGLLQTLEESGEPRIEETDAGTIYHFPKGKLTIVHDHKLEPGSQYYSSAWLTSKAEVQG